MINKHEFDKKEFIDFIGISEDFILCFMHENVLTRYQAFEVMCGNKLNRGYNLPALDWYKFPKVIRFPVFNVEEEQLRVAV